MKILSFDLSSSGIAAVLFNSQLEPVCISDNNWNVESERPDAATLAAETIVEHFKRSIHSLSCTTDNVADAVCMGAFMHSSVSLDEAARPLTPVFTWLDRSGQDGVEYLRSRLGDRLHEITGCRYHPMFPVFKLAAMRLHDPELLYRMKRFVSIKTLLLNRLTGAWIEDHGTASASGLFNITEGDWDSEILSLLDLDRRKLPAIAGRTEIAGHVTVQAASGFGLPAGIPVITGSGDGFLANIGSECETPARVAVTLGTSAVVRQTLGRPFLNRDAGTFCYMACDNAYLLGCAGSNGGNVLDWGRQLLATANATTSEEDVPIFIPLLHGERSPEWDLQLRGSWHGLTARHTAAELSRSILEGVIFNLAHYIEIVRKTSGEQVTDLVLSGNGFLHPSAAPVLASVAGARIWMPTAPGMASLRGAGVCALRALGQPVPPLPVKPVASLPDLKIAERYAKYRRIRESRLS